MSSYQNILTSHEVKAIDLTVKNLTITGDINAPTPTIDQGILYSDNTNAIVSISNGSIGQVLTMGASNPEWSNPGSGPVPSEGLQYSDGVSISSIPTGTINQILASDGTNPYWTNASSPAIPDPLEVNQIIERTAGNGVYVASNTQFKTGGVKFQNNTYPVGGSETLLNTVIVSPQITVNWTDSNNNSVVASSLMRIVKINNLCTVYFTGINMANNNFSAGSSYLNCSVVLPNNFGPISIFRQLLPFRRTGQTVFNNEGMFYINVSRQISVRRTSARNDEGFNLSGDGVYFDSFSVSYYTT